MSSATEATTNDHWVGSGEADVGGAPYLASAIHLSSESKPNLALYPLFARRGNPVGTPELMIQARPAPFCRL